MLRKTFWSLALGTAAGVLVAGNASWAASSEPPLRLLSSLPVPAAAGNTSGGMFSFDISFADRGVYYLADRSNKAVDVVSAELIVTQIVPNNGHAAFAGFTPLRSCCWGQ